MKVILLQDISKIGKRGEVKEVANGYAINVLIAKGQALQATDSELAKWKAKADSVKHKKELVTNAFVRLVSELQGKPIIISDKKKDATGQLFASIKESDIAQALFVVTGVSIDPKQVVIPHSIKNVGKHPFTLKQGQETANCFVTIQ